MPRAKKREADAGVIFEAAILDRVDGESEAGHGAIRAAPPPRPAARARPPHRFGRSSAASAASAWRAAPAAASSSPSSDPPPCRRGRDRGRVLVVERAAHRASAARRASRRRRHTAGTSVGKVRSTDRPVMPSAASASAATAIASTSAAYRIASRSARRRPGRPGARAGCSLPAHPQHLAGIAQAQRPRRVGRAGWRRCAPPAASCRRAGRSCGCEIGSIRRKVSGAIAAPAPDSRLSSNSAKRRLDPLVAVARPAPPSDAPPPRPRSRPRAAAGRAGLRAAAPCAGIHSWGPE